MPYRTALLALAIMLALAIHAPVRSQESAETQLQRAIAALDSAQVERGAQLLRDLLGTLPAAARRSVGVRARVHLAAAHWAIGLQDSAALHFAEAVRLNPFASLDPEIFNPNVQQLFRSVRGRTPALALRVPSDTVLRPEADVLLVAIAVGQPATVTVRLQRLGAPADTVLAIQRIDSTRTLPFSPRVSVSLPWEPGEYQLRAVAETGVARDSILLQLERFMADTVAHEPPLDSVLFRPSTRKGPAVAWSAAAGLLAASAAAFIPMVLKNGELQVKEAPQYRLPVAAGLVIGGIVGTFVGRKDVPIQENIAYNQSLIRQWEERNRRIAADNATRLRMAPIRIRAPQP